MRDIVRCLRKNQTEAETLLWSKLRSRQLLNVKFRRQHPIGDYIVDFYCIEAHLAIEIDGGQHAEKDISKRDDSRTAFLERKGIRVIRFWNHDVLEHLDEVTSEIYATLCEVLSKKIKQMKLSGTLTPPSPLGRERAFYF